MSYVALCFTGSRYSVWYREFTECYSNLVIDHVNDHACYTLMKKIIFCKVLGVAYLL